MKVHSLVLWNSNTWVEQKRFNLVKPLRRRNPAARPEFDLLRSWKEALLSFLPPAGNNTGRKTIRISRMAAVGTKSESKRYLPRKKKGNSPLTGERGERKDQLKSPVTNHGPWMRLDTFFSCSQRHLLSDIRFEALDEIKGLKHFFITKRDLKKKSLLIRKLSKD